MPNAFITDCRVIFWHKDPGGITKFVNVIELM